ncbi:MAG: AbiV family abortive infection protein [Anaerolineaceae bacterium]|nr:AbiV family abortive infection protein [Anaerolineaceae bacterium]
MAKNSALVQWKNSLKVEQIAEGMNAAASNATRLLEDAETLFNLGRYPTAISLAILAIEEAGKTSILRELAIARDGKDVKAAWKAYRSHTKKNALWLFPSMVLSGNRKLEDFRALFEEGSDHTTLLDELKQIGIYSDCLGKAKAHWSHPSKVIDEETADGIIKVARVLCTNKVYTKREVELWVKHMRPVWKAPLPEMKKALHAWFDDMVSEGLAEQGSVPFVDFIGD